MKQTPRIPPAGLLPCIDSAGVGFVRRGMNRRELLSMALASAGLSRMPDAVAQTSFPSRPIKIVVPFAAGGAGDAVARVVGDRAQAELGQPVVIENRSGGNTVIGTQAVARAQPDGHTLLQMSTSNVIIAQLQENLPFDFDKDFQPVTAVGAVPLALAVNAKSDIRSVADLVALAKSTPNGIFYSSGGSGSQSHIAPVWFAQLAKMAATHVAFRGGGPAVQAVLGGQVQFTFASTIAVQELAKTGQLRLIGVTSEKRVPALAQVPTLVEQGFPDFTPMLWYGYAVPATTPRDIVERLHAAFAKAVLDPAVRQRLEAAGLMVEVRDPAEFSRFIREESGRWGRVIKENRIRLD